MVIDPSPAPDPAQDASALDITDSLRALSMREDLVVVPMQFGGRKHWSIKDPLADRYFQLREEEYFVLQQLDGNASTATIQARFEQEFAPRRISESQLHRFVGMLHRQGLLVAKLRGQAQQLLARRNRMRRMQKLQLMTSVLAIRFRGIDPQRLLTWLYPKCRWMFSKWCVALCVMTVLAAIGLVIIQFETLQAKLPRFSAFFSRENLIWIAVAIGISKILHELGHAMTCKHFGGECHEMGLMFLVFTPCLYCNVSDAWMMPNKWHRIAISAGGLYVEIVLAAICTFLWWFSEPGGLNSICLNMMFVCSVSTIFFNGNPLLRYDGYYILADLVEVPNMRQQSSFLLRRVLVRWCLGMELGSVRMLPDRKRGFLIAYSLAALLYRLFVVAAILWFLHVFLKPMGLVVIAQLISVTVLFGLLVVPFWRGGRFLAGATRRGQVKRLRAFGCVVVLTAAVFGICLLPLPYSVSAPVMLELAEGERVYVGDVSGQLTKSKKRVGDRVRADDEILVLENYQIQRDYEDLAGQVATAKARLDRLHEMQSEGANVGSRLQPAETDLRRKQNLLKETEKVRDGLTLKSPIAGIVLPPRRIERRPKKGQLERWSGTPLDPENEGCYLESGTTVCWVGNPNSMVATLVIDQQDIEFLRLGQRVEIQLDQLPAKTLNGRLMSISESRLDVTPPEFAATGLVPSSPDKSGEIRPTHAVFQARVALNPNDLPILLRATGQAKIRVNSRTLGQRILRYLRQTFRFEL